MSGKPWFRDDPGLRSTVRETAQELQPELYWVVDGQTAFLRGTFIVVHDGQVWGRYQVEIEFPHNYPDERPIVRETAGEIPWIADRHMYPDGRACLFLDDEYEWRHTDGMSFRDYLDQAVRSYFVCQAYYDQVEETWLLGDRPHGTKGRLEFYAEIVGTDDLEVILEYLDYIVRDASGHWDCPCGSGKKLRHCHQDVMWKLKDRISAETARKSKRQIEDRVREYLQEQAKERKRAKQVIRKYV